MRKLKLDIEQLAVESFTLADGDPHVRGTIRGKQATMFCTRFDSCDGYTCQISCHGSCRTGLNCQQIC